MLCKWTIKGMNKQASYEIRHMITTASHFFSAAVTNVCSLLGWVFKNQMKDLYSIDAPEINSNSRWSMCVILFDCPLKCNDAQVYFGTICNAIPQPIINGKYFPTHCWRSQIWITIEKPLDRIRYVRMITLLLANDITLLSHICMNQIWTALLCIKLLILWNEKQLKPLSHLVIWLAVIWTW